MKIEHDCETCKARAEHFEKLYKTYAEREETWKQNPQVFKAEAKRFALECYCNPSDKNQVYPKADPEAWKKIQAKLEEERKEEEND